MSYVPRVIEALTWAHTEADVKGCKDFAKIFKDLIEYVQETAVCGAKHPRIDGFSCDLEPGHTNKHRRFSPTGRPDTTW